MSQAPSNLASLFSELNRSGQNGEYDRALKTVNKILQEVPDDDKALHCKVVCLIHLSDFENAYNLLEKHSTLSELQFEKAYCLYRLNRIQEAWSILQNSSQSNDKLKELSAQVLYRLERYDECYEIYKNLIKNSEDDYEEERETNLAAVIANLYAEKGKTIKNVPQFQEHIFEICYNGACILLAQDQYAAALKKLHLAEELCKKSLEDDDVPEEEIESELGVIRLFYLKDSNGYALQMKGKVDQALKLYNQVLKQRPTDIALAAVASNNVVTINKDQNVFDSKKKMKTATLDGLEYKLNSSQCHTIAINHCLLLLHTNQLEQCKRHLQILEKNFKQKSVDATLIHVALLCREKQVHKAVALLKDFAATNPEQSLTISFTLAQLLLTQGHVSQACDILRSLGEISHKPGVVSALVTLYLSLEDRDTAINVFKESINWYKKNNLQSQEMTILSQQYAEFLLKCGQPEGAAMLLEEMRKSDPHNAKILARLISAYSQFDPIKAKEVSRELPSLGEVSDSVSVDNLETTSWSMGTKYVKKSGKSEPSPTVKTTAAEGLVKKKRKKKKGKLPKSYDPNVDPDPERWLPKRERTAFKRRKDRRGGGVGKGTQGTVTGSGDMDLSKPVVTTRTTTTTTTTPTVPVSPNPHGPRQQRPQPVQKKKKKKGRW
ncbi:signal recognition particle subunit SRP72 [Centruroides vittatus]|uniref:signal recognition particle subunit SRP72 n=1 Tax=Centruroides vittatus TaxID=120091 RepID=UPI00350ED163